MGLVAARGTRSTCGRAAGDVVWRRQLTRERDKSDSSKAHLERLKQSEIDREYATAPMGPGFNAATTAAQVIKGIDLTGKTVIVTGGNSGIGVETARAFRSADAKIIVPARDAPKARQNLADLPGVRLDSIDLVDPASIDAFAMPIGMKHSPSCRRPCSSISHTLRM
jgi:hypothetical protein